MIFARFLAMNGTINLIYYVTISGIVILSAFIITKYIGKNLNLKMQGKTIKIAESIKIGNLNVIVIKYENKKYFIAENGNDIQILDTFEETDQESEYVNKKFEDIYSNVLSDKSGDMTKKLFDMKSKYAQLKKQVDGRQKYDK